MFNKVIKSLDNITSEPKGIILVCGSLAFVCYALSLIYLSILGCPLVFAFFLAIPIAIGAGLAIMVAFFLCAFAYNIFKPIQA